MTRRLGLLTLLVALMVLLVGAPASATGTVGRWSLIDSNAYPGATCYFHTTPDDELHRISVRAPIVYAIDSTSGIDRQTVGWRFTIQTSDDALATWQTLVTSSAVTATASDQYNAQWPSLTRTYVRGATLHGAYRALVTMIWYAGGGAVEGSQRVKVQQYVDHYNGADQEHNTRCGDTLG